MHNLYICRRKKTSNHFIVTFLITNNKRSVEKVVQKIFSGFGKKEIKTHRGVLHCYKEKPSVRKKLLELLKGKEIVIIAVILNKKKVYTRLHNEKHLLYNYVTNILLDRLFSNDLIEVELPIHLVASQRETNKLINEKFESYLKRKVKSTHDLEINVEIVKPTSEKSLQVVDFVSWAIFQKYEHKYPSYHQIIQEKIAEENFLFGKSSQ